MTYDLKQQAKEQGIVLDKRWMLTTDDVKHMANYDGESHGELLRVLEDFYDDYHETIYQEMVDNFERFLEEKTKQ